MKLSIKVLLIIFALPLLLGLIVLLVIRSGSDEPATASVPNSSQGDPSFEVRVIVPRLARPLGGILPDWVVKKMDATPSELRFDHATAGAKVGTVGQDRVELTADGWDLLIETVGGEGIAAGTRLVFPIALGGRDIRLRCRPADSAVGHLRTSTRAGSNNLDGQFVIELAKCENADSGKTINWPPHPLTLRGNFSGLQPNRR